MKVEINIPDQESEHFQITHFEVTKEQSRTDMLRATLHGSTRFCPPGNYVKLSNKSGGFCSTIMSNTPDEIQDHLEFVREAKGVVLINGLGLGVVLKMILKKSEVTEIFVIEKEKEIIDVVASYYDEPRVTIIHADALEYQPIKGQIYDYVWHDIWSSICSDNWETMKILHRKYAKRCKWQESWLRNEIKSLYQRDQRKRKRDQRFREMFFGKELKNPFDIEELKKEL